MGDGYMKKNLNPMFSKKLPATKPVSTSTKKDRKKRSDAKKDIKVPVSPSEKKILRVMSYHQTGTPSITQLASSLVKTGLELSYIKFAPSANYPKEKEFIHVKLTQEEFKVLLELSVEWNCSLRKAAHRILLTLLQEEKGAAV